MFHFDLHWMAGADCSDTAIAETRIVCGRTNLTRCREVSTGITRTARLNPKELALWLAYNWWSIRYGSTSPVNAESEECCWYWRMVHNTSGIGGGSVWPDIEITTDGDVVKLVTNPTTANHGETITYLEKGTFLVSVEVFDQAVLSLVKDVITKLEEFGERDEELEAFATGLEYVSVDAL